MQKPNTPTDRAQKVHEKNEVICVVFMFTSKVMVIKMSKMAHVLMKVKNISHSLSKTLKSIWKFWFSSFRKCYGLLDSEQSLARFQSLKILKWAIFDFLMTMTLRVNMITIFLIYILSSPCCYIAYLSFKTFKIQFHGLPSLNYVLVCRIHIYTPTMTFLNRP